MVLKEVKSQPARRALLVIPGSFHQDAGRIKKNSSSIYLVDSASATPMELFQHEKLIPGNIGIYAERILVGNTITMLSTSRGVLCVMICMDFCDNKGQTKDGIWPDLEADFVLVPSYGNDNTLTLHINRARDQHLERGTQVVVAQQMLFGLNSTQVREAKDVGTGQVATAVQGDDTDPASATKNPTRAAIFYRSGTEAHPFLKTTADPPFEILSLDN
jgi:hypothetical protein